MKGEKGYNPEQTVSAEAREIAVLGFLIKSTHWSYQQILDTPVGIVEEMLCYFSADIRAENELNKVAMDSSSGSSNENNTSAPKGLNPNQQNYKGYDIQIQENVIRRTPPPPDGRVVPMMPQ